MPMPTRDTARHVQHASEWTLETRDERRASARRETAGAVMLISPGVSRPESTVDECRCPGLTFGAKADHSGATALDLHQLPGMTKRNCKPRGPPVDLFPSLPVLSAML
ncbi:hypothetical protein PSP6_440007 [Paraburkholderia tropica]|nr:hypothetical protein PSP6_440007 [Paraburkholderia tropica]